MKIDTQEIAEIAATQPAVPRVDLYAGIHKALRAFMTDTLLGLGRMDVEDDLDFASVWPSCLMCSRATWSMRTPSCIQPSRPAHREAARRLQAITMNMSKPSSGWCVRSLT